MESPVTTLDQIPWQTRPQALQDQIHVVEWQGGRLELPRFGFLIADELDQIQTVDPRNALYRLTAEASVDLSRVTSLEPRNAFAFLTRLHAKDLGAKVDLSQEEEDLCIAHSQVIGAYREKAQTLVNCVIIRSCTVILQRIKPGWTDDQTRRLPQPLIALIYEFEQQEEKGGQQEHDPEAAMRALEEDLGKLGEVSRLTATGPIGDTSTGSADDSGLEIKNLAGSALDASRAPTSSRRSAKGTRRKRPDSTTRN